jgi:hypothetical protein
VSEVLPWPLGNEQVMRLYAQLSGVSARILQAAQQERWDDLAVEQSNLVEVTGLIARLGEDDDRLSDLERTSRILHLTAALSDQQAAVEIISRQSDAAALGRQQRLKNTYESA